MLTESQAHLTCLLLLMVTAGLLVDTLLRRFVNWLKSRKTLRQVQEYRGY